MSDAGILPAPQLANPATAHAAWDEERRAFFRLLPTLLESRRGRYVAVPGGGVVAEGTDQVAVALDAYERVGYRPVFVGLITDEPMSPIRLPSPRLLDRGAG